MAAVGGEVRGGGVHLRGGGETGEFERRLVAHDVNGESAALHNQHYNFNDEATPFGSALFAGVVERKLARGSAD